MDLEPVVEFPENPFNAARIYLALMAYPERGAGQPGGQGARFAEAMWEYVIWDGRRHKRLKQTRERLGARADPIPRKRDFEGALNRGLRRIERRVAAFDIVGNQMINGFFNGILRANAMVRDGRDDEAFTRPLGSNGVNPIRREIIAAATPSPRQVVRTNVDRWSERFGLNSTGRSADQSRKEKDLIRRAYRQSVPVMHLAHGFEMIVNDIAPKLDAWEGVDWLLVLLWHSEQWVWDALQRATSFRMLARFPDIGLPPLEAMIELVLPQKMCGIMHPAADCLQER